MIEMVQKFKKLNNFPIIIAGGAEIEAPLSGLKTKTLMLFHCKFAKLYWRWIWQARVELTKRFDLPKW